MRRPIYDTREMPNRLRMLCASDLWTDDPAAREARVWAERLLMEAADAVERLTAAAVERRGESGPTRQIERARRR